MDTLQLSIIIPTFNTCSVTLQCVKSLRDNPPQASHEIIVIDNHSADDTVARLSREFPDIMLLRNESNLGFSKACNRAAKAARGQFLCFLNSDTHNGKMAIDTLVEWLKSH